MPSSDVKPSVLTDIKLWKQIVVFIVIIFEIMIWSLKQDWGIGNDDGR